MDNHENSRGWGCISRLVADWAPWPRDSLGSPSQREDMVLAPEHSKDETLARDILPPTWQRLEAASSAALSDTLGRHIRERPAAETLKLEGDGVRSVFFLLSGWFAVSKSMEDGHRQILDLMLAGDVLNPGSADASASAVHIEVLADVAFSAVPLDVWERLLDEQPQIRRLHDTNMKASMARMAERMLRLGKGSAASRIAYALIELCMRLDAIGAPKKTGSTCRSRSSNWAISPVCRRSISAAPCGACRVRRSSRSKNTCTS